jgi:hypothetical protein
MKRNVVFPLAAVAMASILALLSPPPAVATHACYYSGDNVNTRTLYLDAYSTIRSSVTFQWGYTCVGQLFVLRVTQVTEEYWTTSTFPVEHALGAFHLQVNGQSVQADLRHTSCAYDCYISRTWYPSREFDPYNSSNQYRVFVYCNQCGAAGAEFHVYHDYINGSIWTT